MVELASDCTNIMQHYAVFGTQNRKTMAQRRLPHKAQSVNVEINAPRKNKITLE